MNSSTLKHELCEDPDVAPDESSSTTDFVLESQPGLSRSDLLRARRPNAATGSTGSANKGLLMAAMSSRRFFGSAAGSSSKLSSGSASDSSLNVHLTNQVRQQVFLREIRSRPHHHDPSNTQGFDDGDDDDDDDDVVHTEENESSQVVVLRGKLLASYTDRAIRLFNLNPRKGLSFIEKFDLVALNGHASEAAFLRRTRGINKEQIGVVLGEEKCVGLLREYTNLFDFSDCTPTCLGILKGLREFLSHFKLPGEAQKIDRILETFSTKFLSDVVDDTKSVSSDVVHILAFTTIVLNSDLHNPNNPKKMTKDEFFTSVSYFPELERFDDVSALYDDVKKREIQFRHDREDVSGNLFVSPTKQGYLMMRSSNNLRWRKRFFVLSDQTLYYFQTSEDVDIRGLIPLEELQLVERKGGNARGGSSSRRGSSRPSLGVGSDAEAEEKAHDDDDDDDCATTSSSQRSCGCFSTSSFSSSSTKGSHLGSKHPNEQTTAETRASSHHPRNGSSSTRMRTVLLLRRASTSSSLRTGGSSSSSMRTFELESTAPGAARVKSTRVSKTKGMTLGKHRTIKLKARSESDLVEWTAAVQKTMDAHEENRIDVGVEAAAVAVA